MLEIFNWIGRYWQQVIAWGIISFLVFLFLREFFYRWLDKRNQKNLVFMRVSVPRSDSKLDKEQQTKKDFKDTVAVMQQLYRAIFEIGELNFWNKINTFLFRQDRISFELYLEDRKLYFYVVTYPYYQTIVEKQITTFYPDAVVEHVDPPKFYEPGYDIKGYAMVLSKPFYWPIKTYKVMEEDPLNNVTNVLDKLEENERAAIQFVIHPAGDKWRAKAKEAGTELFKGQRKSFGGGFFLWNIPGFNIIGKLMDFFLSGSTDILDGTSAPGASRGDAYIRMLQSEEEKAKRIGAKSAEVGFYTYVRVFAASKEGNKRVDDILNNMVVSFNVFNDADGNVFQNKRMLELDFVNTPILYAAYEQRAEGWFQKPSLLTPQELATLFHFPHSNYNKAPIIYWKQYKILPAPIELPEEGIVLGYNSYRGERKIVRMKADDRTRHHYIIGKSGTGKSTFISYIARQDMWMGNGLGVIDPHGDLAEELLTYVPKSRARDVIVFNPADRERPMGLNILEAKTEEQKDRASLDATEIFIKLFGDEIFGPRIQHYFRNACLTLMADEDEGATLIDVPRIFTDDDFMKYKVSKVKNPVVRSFWEHEYANTGDREKQEMIPYFSSKFGPFITNTTMRNIIGQSKSAFDFRECMDTGKILLVNLSKGTIGDINAQLLGLVLVNKLSMSALGRADMPKDQRRPFYLYVDEFQNFATDTFATILSEARKYQLALIMAHQYINQLVTTKFGQTSSQVRDAVFGNVGTMMSFKVGAEDAEYLAKEYAPVLSEQDIVGIANYKAYIKLNIDNTTSRPFSLDTVYDTRGQNEKVAEILKKYSSLKYGRKRMFVDQEIEARLGISGSFDE